MFPRRSHRMSMALYRAGSLLSIAVFYLFYPLWKITSRNASVILMYHGVSDYANAGSEVGYYFVSVKDFERQMEYLHKKRYEVLPLHRIVQPSARKGRKVFITFDDGFKNNYQYAFPILKRFQFPAIIFLSAGHIDRQKNFDWFQPREEGSGKTREANEHLLPLSWQEIRLMKESDIYFGSHGLSHLNLANLGEARLDEEIVRSKEILEERMGPPIEYFSFPFSFPEGKRHSNFRESVRQILIGAKYRGAVTSMIGFHSSAKDDDYVLKRIPILCYDGMAGFRAKLHGAFNWIRMCQLFYKRLWT